VACEWPKDLARDLLQRLLGFNFSVAVWVGYNSLFGIAVETGVVMVVYLHEAMNRRLATGAPLKHEDIAAAVIEGAVLRLRPKLMTVCVVLAEPRAHPVGDRRGRGCDEARCRPNRRRHDYIHDPRPHSRSGILRPHKGADATPRDFAAKRTAVRLIATLCGSSQLTASRSGDILFAQCALERRISLPH
jgi:hypothetical protein